MREQVRLAATKVQSVMRGHFGRCMFRARCISATNERMENSGDYFSGDSPASEATSFVDARASDARASCDHIYSCSGER